MARGPLLPMTHFLMGKLRLVGPAEAVVGTTGRDMGLPHSLESAPCSPTVAAPVRAIGPNGLGERIIYLYFKIFPISPIVVGLFSDGIKLYFHLIS